MIPSGAIATTRRLKSDGTSTELKVAYQYQVLVLGIEPKEKPYTTEKAIKEMLDMGFVRMDELEKILGEELCRDIYANLQHNASKS